jgi:bacteriorhodopsin
MRSLVRRSVAVLGMSALTLVPSVALASGGNLESSDFVGMSFWLISMALVASTVFFFIERDRVNAKWKTSLTVSGLVTLVAAVHYFYMRDYWISTNTSPTVFRYIDWLITVPLLMVEFYLILAAITKVPAGVFWRLIIGTTLMLLFGYLGEAKYISYTAGFVIGTFFWLVVLYEIFKGEASRISSNDASPAVQSAFKLMRLIVTFGWAIYPVGYYMGYMMGADNVDPNMLNIIYNLADVLNKIAFGLIIWHVAVTESEA